MQARAVASMMSIPSSAGVVTAGAPKIEVRARRYG
jgi:hypothetical protein